MNFEKALKILGLTKDYTEEELKKAYRQLISKYHPDRYENKSDSEKQMAEKKSKEINEAREYLEKCLKNKTNNSYSRSSSNSYARSATKSNSSREDEKLQRQKESILRECKKQIEEISSINDNNDKLLRKVKDILSDTFFRYATHIYLADTIFELTILQGKLNVKVKEILDTYSKEYCKKYSIVLDEKTKLNLNCYSLKILQHKLEELKAKNESFIGRIEEEFNKYVYYKGFDDIQIILLKLKKEILLEYKNKDIEDLLISKFNTKALQAFEEYYKRLAILNSMKNRCQNSRDSKIIELLIKLENSLSSPEEFEKVFNELNTRISIALVAKNDCIPSKPYIIEEKLDFNSNQPFSEKEENIKIKNNLKFFDKIFKKIKDQNPSKKRIKKY